MIVALLLLILFVLLGGGRLILGACVVAFWTAACGASLLAFWLMFHCAHGACL